MAAHYTVVMVTAPTQDSTPVFSHLRSDILKHFCAGRERAGGGGEQRAFYGGFSTAAHTPRDSPTWRRRAVARFQKILLLEKKCVRACAFASVCVCASVVKNSRLLESLYFDTTSRLTPMALHPSPPLL